MTKKESKTFPYGKIDRKRALELTDGKGKKALPLADLISAGNKKLPKDTAIFNMGPAMNCPSEKLGLCQAVMDGKIVCYALKPERLYPGCKPYRDRQEKFWKGIDANDFATQFILMNALRKNKFTALRINEAGDFWSQKCVDKAEKIAFALSTHGVAVYVYTARKDLDFSKVKHLVINGSGFKKAGVSNVFQYIEKLEDKPAGFALCPGDCRVCTRCQKHNKNTAVLKH
jgi:hypothetical protein